MLFYRKKRERSPCEEGEALFCCPANLDRLYQRKEKGWLETLQSQPFGIMVVIPGGVRHKLNRRNHSMPYPGGGISRKEKGETAFKKRGVLRPLQMKIGKGGGGGRQCMRWDEMLVVNTRMGKGGRENTDKE